jgi:hypothetical protein
MRPVIAGFLIALAYFVAIGTLIGMTLPTEARIQAYLDAVAVSQAQERPLETPQVS